ATLDDSYRRNPGTNAQELLRQTSLLGVLALGAAIVIISGGIDLSSGSVVAFSSTIFASIVIMLAPHNSRGDPLTRDLASWILLVAAIGTLVVSLLIGSFHAWLITVVKLPPFVATLASLVGLRSFARVLIASVNTGFSSQTDSGQIYIYDAAFRRLGSVWWIPLIIFVVLSLLTWLIISRTVTGRHLYAMGGNETAARLSGIRTERLKWLAYAFSALTAGIAGILYTSSIGSADPTTLGIGYELNAIAAAVVGGCSLQGGIGTVPGIALGALFLRVVIDSVAKTVKIKSDEFQGIVVGVLVVLAVTLNELRGQRAGRRHFFAGGLGIVTWLNLTLLSGVLATIIVSTHKLTTGIVVSAIVGALLGTLAMWERSRRS
ncbi:MAG TPA: ABC transporter permease, partial [Planctomycetaceae bacterium]|nr:ABC transporter permease [Planctomycetaceae bacterium]